VPSPMVHSVAVKRLGGIIFDEAVPAVNLDAFVGARMKCGFVPFSNPDWLAATNHIRNSCDLRSLLSVESSSLSQSLALNICN